LFTVFSVIRAVFLVSAYFALFPLLVLLVAFFDRLGQVLGVLNVFFPGVGQAFGYHCSRSGFC